MFKDVDTADPTPDFTFNWSTPNPPVDPPNAAMNPADPFTLSHGESEEIFVHVESDAPGVVTITEQDPSGLGFAFTGVDCPGADVVQVAGGVQVTLAWNPDAPQQTDVVCTFNNAEIVGEPAMSLLKTGVFNDESGDGLAQPGETISYSFLVTNTGSVDLTGITVSDPLSGLSAISCPSSGTNTIALLTVGSNETCTATYSVTQPDINFGQVDNTAMADSDQTDEVQSPETVPLVQGPELALLKTGLLADGGDGATPGDIISYSLLVTNSGNITLNNIVVMDLLPGLSAIVCPTSGNNTILTLAPQAFETCTATYAITQDDINAGQVDNTATADSDETDPVNSPETVPLGQTPMMSLAKTGQLDTGGDGATPGDLITYSLLVTNTGNIPLNNIVVTDPLPGLSDIVCPISSNNTILTLAPGANETCTATYAITQDDINTGRVNNVATADSDETDPVNDPATVPLAQNPSISVVKTADTGEISGEGVVAYSYEVTNTGNIHLTDIIIVDDNDEDDASCPDLELAPGASMTCSATHIVTQEELTANGSPTPGSGQLTNTVTVTALPEGGGDRVSANDSLTIPFAAIVARFMVTKDFTDDSTAGVMVYISCDTGLPLTQDFELFDSPDSFVTFVVNSYIPGTMTCTITEEPVPGGYTGTYEAAAGADGVAGSITGGANSCVFGEIVGGHFECEITNTLDSVAVTVDKYWDIPNPGSEFPMYADIRIWCDAPIEGGSQDPGSKHYYRDFNDLYGDTTAIAQVLPNFPSSSCWAVEASSDSAVEVDNGCGDSLQTARMTVSAGNGDHCTITNTVFFVGIPTLNHYGLALLALLMLGVGAVGFRRFA